MLRKYYDNTKQVKLVVPASSTSTIMSSLAAEINNYIMRFFPKNYIKSIMFDTAIPKAIHNANKRFNKDIDKPELPALVITPEFVQDGGNTAPLAAWGEIASRHGLKRDLNNSYYQVLLDPDNKFSLYYDCDYLTMSLNFKITVKTWIQNVEVIRMLKNGLMPNLHDNLNQCMLKTEIPKFIVKTMADGLGYDLTKREDLFDFQVYLKQASRRTYSIEKSVNMNTGHVGFFMIDPSTAKIYIDDIDASGAVIRENQTEGDYVINFRVQASVPAANNFILSIDRKLYEDLIQKPNNPDEETGSQDNTTLTLTLNDAILTHRNTIRYKDSSGNDHIGQVVSKEVLSFDINDKSRFINMSRLIDPEICAAHSYLKSKNLDTSALINFLVVVRNNDKIKYTGKNIDNIMVEMKPDGTPETKDEAVNRVKENGDAIVYYDTMTIELPNTNSEVLIYTYIDRAVFESAITARESDINLYGDNFLTVAYVGVKNDDGEIVKKPVVVNSFKNAYEMNSTDLDKSLRVSTIYGIGYFLLVPEDDPRSTNLKVCVGYTESGLPIIYTFVYYKNQGES